MTDPTIKDFSDNKGGRHEAVSNLKYSRSRKAWNAGIAGAVAAGGAVSLTSLVTDHGIDTQAVALAVGAVVTGFVGGFLGAFFSTNAEG